MGPIIRPGAQAGGLGFSGYRAVTEGYLEIRFGIFDPGNFILVSIGISLNNAGVNGIIVSQEHLVQAASDAVAGRQAEGNRAALGIGRSIIDFDIGPGGILAAAANAKVLRVGVLVPINRRR
jgi:hypothetical protein